MLSFKELIKGQKAQTVVEYTIILGLVALVLMAMQAMIRRGTQAMIRVVADQVGNQERAEQAAFRDPDAIDAGGNLIGGHLDKTYSLTRSSRSKERQDNSDFVSYLYDDTVITTTNAEINLGFFEK